MLALYLKHYNYMNYLKVILLLFLSNTVAAQSKMLQKRSLQIDIGAGRYGTGDMDGYSINSEFRKYVRNRLSFTIGLGATIHHGFFPYGDVDVNGRIKDVSIRYVAGGLQLTSKMGYSFLRNKYLHRIRLD